MRSLFLREWKSGNCCFCPNSGCAKCRQIDTPRCCFFSKRKLFFSENKQTKGQFAINLEIETPPAAVESDCVSFAAKSCSRKRLAGLMGLLTPCIDCSASWQGGSLFPSCQGGRRSWRIGWSCFAMWQCKLLRNISFGFCNFAHLPLKTGCSRTG